MIGKSLLENMLKNVKEQKASAEAVVLQAEGSIQTLEFLLSRTEELDETQLKNLLGTDEIELIEQ